MARHNDTGRWGEQIAADALVCEGFAIKERNWRLGHLEIDIIAQRGNEYVFAEVKTRSDKDSDPLEAVGPRKIMNMVRAADAFLNYHSDSLFEVRFDLFSISGTPDDYTVEHIPDAFQAPIKTYR